MHDFLYNITSDIFDDEFLKKFCNKCSDIELRDDLGHLHTFTYCEIKGNVCPHFDGDSVTWWLQEEYHE